MKQKIRCPKCNVLGDIDAPLIPSGAAITCPKCLHRFSITDAIVARPSEDTGLGEAQQGMSGGEVARPAPASPAPFRFTGTAAEYFKIWIVNIALTILTLGIYSAWAKVRKKRYFYGNTQLMGSPFEYLADPIKILKGRLIVFAFFASYSFMTAAVPLTGPILGLLFMAIFPWIVVKAMKFKTRNASYRNIRFNFIGTYRESLSVFLGYGLLSGITLGLAYPYFIFKKNGFTIGKSLYGSSPFEFTAGPGGFYKGYIKAGLILILAIVLITVLTGLLVFTSPVIAAVITPLIYALGFLTAVVYLKTYITNLVFSNASVGKSRLNSTLKLKDMMWIYVTNVAAIVFTLGLMIPWAAVRTAKYRLEHLHLIVGEDFESFLAGEKEKVSSFGEEMDDFFDLDIGL